MSNYRPETFAANPIAATDGIGFLLSNGKSLYRVTNMSFESYNRFLEDNPKLYTIRAIPISEWQCMVCDDKIHPKYYDAE